MTALGEGMERINGRVRVRGRWTGQSAGSVSHAVGGPCTIRDALRRVGTRTRERTRTRTRPLLLLLCALLPACAARQPGPRKELFNPPGAQRLAPYSTAVRSGNLVFLSGVIGSRPG